MKLLSSFRTSGIINSLIFIVLFQLNLKAQTKEGQLTGRILDEAGNEPLFGAVLVVTGTGKGATADFDGNFRISLPEGSYEVVFKYLGYQIRQFQGVKIKSGENTPLTVYLRQMAKDIKEVEIVVEAARNNENALLKDQRAASSIGSGITAEMLTKTPDRNLSESFRRISGTSVREGKFAMVRGLSERYNMGQLNGVAITSTESDKKAFSLELFPSNLLDKIVVSKTATPDQPGDVAGGLIKIQTLDIPNANTMQVSLAGEYNSLTTFKDFSRIKQSGTDNLGFDNGFRSIPVNAWSTNKAFANEDAQERSRQSTSFNHQVVPEQFKATPNFSGQFSMGRRGKVFGKTSGLVFSLNYYQNNLRNFFSSEYPTINPGLPITENDQTFQDRYKTLTSLSAILNASIRPDAASKISFRNFFSQTGSNLSQFSRREKSEYANPSAILYDEKTTTVSFYEQNSLLSHQLGYERNIGTEGGKLEVITGLNYLYRNTPDYSRMIYARNGTYDIEKGKTEKFTASMLGAGNPTSFSNDISGKFFSEMKELSTSGEVNYSQPFKILNVKNLAKAGVLIQNRERSFDGRNYLYKGGELGNSVTSLSPDSLFREENFAPNYLTLFEITLRSDFYNARTRTRAAFLMNETSIGNNGSKIIYGFRHESYFQEIDAANPPPAKVRNIRSSTVNDFLPSVNLKWNLGTQVSLRGAYSQTVNRPELRELAGFLFYDPNQNFYIYGNPELVRAKVTNYDLKAEWYASDATFLSLNLFYKNFKNPIEVTRGFQTAITVFTYSNRDEANSYGWEVEGRTRLKGLDSLMGTRFFSRIGLFGNFSWIRSEVLYKQINFKRPIHGQSPYIINAGIQYSGENPNIEVFLSYNRIGPRVAFLDDVSFGALIWEKPRDIVDISIGKTVGKWNFKLTGGDLLGQDLIQYIVLDRGGRQPDNKGLFGWISNAPNYQAGQDVPFFRFTNPRNIRFSVSVSL